MSARETLIGRLVIFGMSEQSAVRAVDAFAHELAEKQRAYARRMEGHPGFQYLAPGVFVGADHIDPEVSDG